MPERPIESDAAGAIILERLAAIEQTEAVRILYACESGSRAWGFASPDSDYDVRFPYVRPRDWYLSIDLERRRDVIERPIEGVLDINGWDLRKALQLMRKSNPPLFEWLHSPLVYRAQAEFRNGPAKVVWTD
jgi:predicted nucleotidyltransferase